MFFKLVWWYALSAFLTRFGGVIFIVVLLHLSDGHWLVTHGAQVNVTNTVALVKVKGRHIDGTLAAEGGEIILNLYAYQSFIISVTSSTHQLLQIFVSCSISVI